jgi:SAM-dependent methyltransferase
MTVNEDKLNAFVGKAVGDLGAAMSAVLVLIGDELGLYSALAEGRLTSGELAERTGTSERYVREWLANQAAGGYVEYDSGSDEYYLSEEQALCLASPNGPMDLPGGYSIVEDLFQVKQRAWRTSEAAQAWNGRAPSVLVPGALNGFSGRVQREPVVGLAARTRRCRREAQRRRARRRCGCGHGVSTILMAQTFPGSQFVGIDYHDASIETARERAAKVGVAERATFEVASAKEFPGKFDLIAFFDCLHDMANPAGAARHARQALKPDGHCMLVEPFAGDSLADNLNPVGRVFYGASSLICVPVSLAQHGPALGAQAGGDGGAAGECTLDVDVKPSGHVGRAPRLRE